MFFSYFQNQERNQATYFVTSSANAECLIHDFLERGLGNKLSQND